MRQLVLVLSCSYSGGFVASACISVRILSCALTARVGIGIGIRISIGTSISIGTPPRTPRQPRSRQPARCEPAPAPSSGAAPSTAPTSAKAASIGVRVCVLVLVLGILVIGVVEVVVVGLFTALFAVGGLFDVGCCVFERLCVMFRLVQATTGYVGRRQTSECFSSPAFIASSSPNSTYARRALPAKGCGRLTRVIWVNRISV